MPYLHLDQISQEIPILLNDILSINFFMNFIVSLHIYCVCPAIYKRDSGYKQQGTVPVNFFLVCISVLWTLASSHVSCAMAPETAICTPASVQETQIGCCPETGGQGGLSQSAEGRKRQQEAIGHFDDVQNETET